VSLLAEAPSGRHFAQFHRDTDSEDRRRDTLTESAFNHSSKRACGAATACWSSRGQSRDRLFERLAAGKISPQSLRDPGQLSVLDAEQITAGLVAGGLPEWHRFGARSRPPCLAPAIRPRHARLCEIANALWHAGTPRPRSASRTSGIPWPDVLVFPLLRLHDGYAVRALVRGPARGVGRTHSDILGTPEDEEFRGRADRASKEIFGISLTQMTGISKEDGARRFPSGQRTMLWVKRNLPMSTAQLAERARHYFRETRA